MARYFFQRLFSHFHNYNNQGCILKWNWFLGNNEIVSGLCWACLTVPFLQNCLMLPGIRLQINSISQSGRLGESPRWKALFLTKLRSSANSPHSSPIPPPRGWHHIWHSLLRYLQVYTRLSPTWLSPSMKSIFLIVFWNAFEAASFNQ